MGLLILAPARADLATQVLAGTFTDAGSAACPSERKTVPTIVLDVCEDCHFSAKDKSVLLNRYSETAMAAGYNVNPFARTAVKITETGVQADGKPYVKGVVRDKQFKVADPHPGETLASAVGVMVFVIASSDR